MYCCYEPLRRPCPQIMFNLDKIYMILDEMVVNGCIVETSKARILEPIKMMEQHR